MDRGLLRDLDRGLLRIWMKEFLEMDRGNALDCWEIWIEDGRFYNCDGRNKDELMRFVGCALDNARRRRC